MHAMIVTTLVAAALLAPERASAQSSKFDGTWSVEIVTEKGDCDRAYRYPVAVRNGQARYAGPEDFNVSGSIAASGAVSGTIARGSDRASVRGRLAGATGSGTWTAAGSARNCSGRWTAEKRG